MAKTREIKNRIKAVSNIKRITNTMQLIATAKFQQASRRATATKPYTEKVAELVGELAQAAGGGGVDHPLLHRPDPPAGREAMLVLTSNRGLCGGYNASILRTANALMNKAGDTEFPLEIVGKKGIAYYRFMGREIALSHSEMDDEPGYDEVNAVAERLIDEFTAGKYDAVHVAYMKFISNSKQSPVVETLLPAEPPEADEDEGPAGEVTYDFSPDPATLLNELLPITVKTRLFQFFNDAAVSEHVARMVAMKTATDNADQMQTTLTRRFNRARQTQITNELIEVVTGAQAVA